jgi:hypothetical protein
MSHNFHLPPKPPSVQRDRANLVMALCFIWVLASAVGFAVQALAATPTALGGIQGTAVGAPNHPLKTKNQTKTKQTQRATNSLNPQAWLSAGVWRAGPCDTAQNFQTFVFSPLPKVEVGSGKPGEGEKLELLRVTRLEGELIQVETRVCAPVGCNQTIERYKVINTNQMQEWHFEGRLPDHAPYVLVADGSALDGSGPGRTFNRCAT